MVDNGRRDEKIIAIPLNDPNYNMYRSIQELPKHIFDEMKHFFSVYKNLEHKETAVDEVKDADAAIKIIEEAIQLAKKNNIKIITSSPCFELWFLLHYDYTTANMDSEEVLQVVSGNSSNTKTLILSVGKTMFDLEKFKKMEDAKC